MNFIKTVFFSSIDFFENRSSHIFLWILFSTIIFCGLEINNIYPIWSKTNQLPVVLGPDSYLVLDRISKVTTNIPDYYPLYIGDQPYLSQVGIQGIVISGLIKLLSAEPIGFALAMSHIFCLATSLLLGLYVVNIYLYFNKFSAIMTFVLISFSPVLAEFSISLYWTLFLSLAPFVWTWVFYPLLLKKQDYKYKIFFYSIIAILIFFKCMCGYEYITNVVLSPFIPIFFYHWQQKDNRQYIYKPLLTILLVSIIGYILAMVVQIIQLGLLFQINGLDVLLGRAKDRLFGNIGGDLQAYIDNSIQRLKDDDSWLFNLIKNKWISPNILIGIISFFTYFTKPAFQFPLSPNFSLSISTGICTIISLVCLVLLKIQSTSQHLKQWILTINLALLVSLSWNVVAFNYMSLHLHLNTITFFIPFLLIFYVFLGYIFREIFIRLFSKTPKFLIYFFMSLALVLLTHNLFKDLVSLQKQAMFNTKFNTKIVLPEVSIDNKSLTGVVDKIDITNANTNVNSDIISSEMLRSKLMPQKSSTVLLISGWVVDKEDFSRDISILVIYDKMIIAWEDTNYERPDVESSFGHLISTPGFSINIPVLGTEADSNVWQDKLKIYALDTSNPSRFVRLK